MSIGDMTDDLKNDEGSRRRGGERKEHHKEGGAAVALFAERFG